jgi:hypothetical protein
MGTQGQRFKIGGADEEANRPAREDESIVPYLSGAPGLVLTLAMVAFTLIGALVVTINLNPFWIWMAIWTLYLALLLARKHQSVRSIASWSLMVMMSLPFIVVTVGVFEGVRPLDVRSPMAWLVESIALFALCLITITLIDLRGGMHMSGLFISTVTFLFFETSLVIQGWVSWYSDLYLGTNLIPLENEYMAFFTASTATGLGLAIVLNRHMKRSSYDEFKKRVAGRGRE